jgi:hypothetical protein
VWLGRLKAEHFMRCDTPCTFRQGNDSVARTRLEFQSDTTCMLGKGRLVISGLCMHEVHGWNRTYGH